MNNFQESLIIDSGGSIYIAASDAVTNAYVYLIKIAAFGDLSASRATIENLPRQHYLWGITEVGTQITVGVRRLNGSDYNVGLVTIDKTSLNRQGRFTSSNLYDQFSNQYTLKHFDNDVYVSAYENYLVPEQGFYFYDLATDTLEKFIQTRVTGPLKGLEIVIDS